MSARKRTLDEVQRVGEEKEFKPYLELIEAAKMIVSEWENGVREHPHDILIRAIFVREYALFYLPLIQEKPHLMEDFMVQLDFLNHSRDFNTEALSVEEALEHSKLIRNFFQ